MFALLLEMLTVYLKTLFWGSVALMACVLLITKPVALLIFVVLVAIISLLDYASKPTQTSAPTKPLLPTPIPLALRTWPSEAPMPINHSLVPPAIREVALNLTGDTGFFLISIDTVKKRERVEWWLFDNDEELVDVLWEK